MVLITYDEALVQLCDWFDSLISPRTIARSNTNIIFLLLKAIAKGWEIMNNTAVSLSKKFDPASCSNEDLVSIAYLVGTERRKGTSSGLLVTLYNNGDTPALLPAGTYTYMLDDDTPFTYKSEAPVTIGAGESFQMMFLSEQLGSFHVTLQSDITVTGIDANGNEINIPADFSFFNSDNADLLGYTDETDLEFRKRILSDTERQDTIKELELSLRNLPYVFDCNIVFNQTSSNQTIGNYTIKPFYMLILLSTAKYTTEIAEIIASYGIYPTVNVQNVSHEMQYDSPVFATGSYLVYANDFDKKRFSATVTYHADPNYISSELAEDEMRAGILATINSNKHTDRITAEDFYDAVNTMNIKGVTLLGVQFFEDSEEKVYIDFLRTEIAELPASSLTFAEV